MSHFLSILTHWYWFGFGIILLIIELLIINSGFLLWIAISTFFVGFSLLLFDHLPGSYQLMIFAFSLLVCAAISRKYFRKNPIQSDQPRLNRRTEQYIGRTVILEKAIENGRGIIRLDDSIWTVEGPNLPTGTQVRIVGADGLVLKIKACI